MADADMKNQPDAFLEADDMLSALADGALSEDAFAAAMLKLESDDDVRAQWHAYHVVGDVLRSQDLAGGTGDMAFLTRLEARLALEPAPMASRSALANPALVQVVAPVMPPAANNDVFRWKLASGFASLAAVAAIGWQALQWQAPPNGAMLAQASSVAAPQGFQAVRADVAPVVSAAASTTAEVPPVMLRNAQLDELLAAHNRAVGGAALQSQTGSLRNVSLSEEAGR